MKPHPLTPRQHCDLTLILSHAFSPLTGFLAQSDYNAVLNTMRLTSHAPWPIPVVLDVTSAFAEKISLQDKLELRDQDGSILAIMTVTDKWVPDKNREALAVYGTNSTIHPGVHYLMNRIGDVYLGGPVEAVNTSSFEHLQDYHTPTTLKRYFQEKNIDRIVAFQTRNPMHRAHFELTLRAAKNANAHLLIHPSVGETKVDDVDADTRIRCYRQVMRYYPENSATLSLLPLAMRMAGPREALWHAIIRKNYGCTHFIVGRDHAGVGEAFNPPYAAQQLVMQYADEIGIEILPFQALHYVENKNAYLTENEITAADTIQNISGTQFRALLKTHAPIPAWFSFPAVIETLQKTYVSRSKMGVTLFFTALPSAGKSTIAKALSSRLSSLTDRRVSILDGDLFRQMTTRQNAFTKEDRDNNIKHIGIIAAEITKHGGIAICACIAPYEETRQWVRNRVSEQGAFVEIYLSTSLAVCEARDPKGNYQKARANIIQHFTGVSDPYETPSNPEIVLDTATLSIEASTQKIIQWLTENGYLAVENKELCQV